MNWSGQLGDGTTTDRHAPVQVGTDTTWVAVAAGANHTIGLKADGTLWAWGDNLWGQLGDATAGRHAPGKVGTGTTWVAVAAGAAHTLARKADGTLWAWGQNSDGQLGDGTTTTRRSPIQVDADTTWAAMAGGYAHSLARKADGTLWAWGDNFSGQLGDGTTMPRRHPVQVDADTTWVAVATGSIHTVALKANDTLWAWGYNAYGQLGDGSTTDRYAPTLVAFLAKATLTNPPPGTTLPGSDVTFTWSAGKGVTAYHLFAGSTPGGIDIADQALTGLSQTVAGFPTDGRTVYLRLSSYLGGTWQYNDYTFTAATWFYGLSVALGGSATGTVTSNVGGINCPGTCTANFTPGTPVTLTANAGAGGFFREWWGACTGSGSCQITMNGLKSVAAVFSRTFTDIVAGGTIVKAVHFTELRAAIDTLRSHYQWLPAFAWTDPTLSPGSTAVKRAHLIELRTALDQAYTAAGGTHPAYTDPMIMPGQTVIKASHLNELRSYVRDLE